MKKIMGHTAGKLSILIFQIMVGPCAKNESRHIGQDFSQMDTTGQQKTRSAKKNTAKINGERVVEKKPNIPEVKIRDRMKWRSFLDASCTNGREMIMIFIDYFKIFFI